MKHYIVFYAKGMSGQWFTWFVNEHAGFRKTKLELEPNNKREYNVDATIYPKVFHHVYYEYNMPYNKRCLLIFNNHFYDSIIENEKNIIKILKKYTVDRLIFLNAKKNSLIINAMNERNKFFSLEDNNGDNFVMVNSPCHNKDITIVTEIIKKHMTVDIFEFDITRLLSLEESAYYELCEFLDVVPLTDWKDMVAAMMLEIYDLDVRK